MPNIISNGKDEDAAEEEVDDLHNDDGSDVLFFLKPEIIC